MINLIEADPSVIASVHNHLQQKAKLLKAIQHKRDVFEKSLIALKDKVEVELKAIELLQRQLQKHSSHAQPEHQGGPKKSGARSQSKAATPKAHRAKRGENKNKVINYLKQLGKGATQSEIAKATQLFAPYINLIIRDGTVFNRKKGRGGLITLVAN